MSQENKYRYSITDRIGTIIASPLGESDFSVEWSRDNQDGKRRYEKGFGGKITFVGSAYKNFLLIENSPYRCDVQNVLIERNCNEDGWIEWFNGTIYLSEGTWDLDRCSMSVTFEENNPEKCFDDNKGEVLNLFNRIFQRQKVKLYRGDTVIERKFCIKLDSEQSGQYWCEGGNPTEDKWVPYYHSETLVADRYRIETRWARQTMALDCAEDPPTPEWLLIGEDCLNTGKRTYAKEPSLYNCQYSYDPTEEEEVYNFRMSCDILGENGGVKELKNGLFLNNIIEVFVAEFCPGLTVRSRFFQINPLLPSDFNYVTMSLSKVNSIMVFQKSDVKRQISTGMATKAEWTFEKLMTALKNMFNVEWRVQNGEFIIEHVSFFTQENGMDLTLPEYKKYLKGKRSYSYKNEDIPSREHWQWMEQRPTGDFAGMDIVYNGGCVTKASKDIVKNYPIEDVNTDIQFIMENPDPKSELVSDEGFVFVATRRKGGEYYIITEPGILEEGRVNNSLAMAQLQRDYFQHERPLILGNMNGNDTIFLSAIPIKQGVTISIPLCCGNDFDPDEKILTPLGVGIVDKAVFRFKTSMLDLDLLYEANTEIDQNSPPTAVNKVATTYLNEPIEIILEGSDPDGTVEGVEIVIVPMHGEVDINGFTATYTPDTGYVGDDIFTYKVYDNWGERSNAGMVQITIRAANVGPSAVNDSYTAWSGQALTVAAPGLFANDSDDVGFTLNSFNATSVQGGTVVVNADGSFTYTPPVSYVGADSFTYSIKDENNLTDSATVFIDVRNQDSPIGNTDRYQVTKNTVLEVDGNYPNLSVLENDTTPIPGSYTYEATAETKSTEEGGTVTINADGTFSYTPPTGFEGVDSFEYTVSNGLGSSQGTVQITVLPTVYVRLARSNVKTENTPINCGGSMRNGGSITKGDYRFSFFSDVEGTTAFNVTGLNLKLLVRSGVRFSQSAGYDNSYSMEEGANGVIWVWKNQTVTREISLDCDSVQVGYYEFTAELQDTDGYIII